MRFGKIIIFIAVPIFALSLTSCGKTPDSSETESTSTADFESAEGKQIRLRSCSNRNWRTSFRHILPLTALKILDGR